MMGQGCRISSFSTLSCNTTLSAARAEGPPQGFRPPGGAARSDVRGDPVSALVDLEAADGLPRARTPTLIGAFTLLLIAAPFIGLAFATQWSDFHFAPGDTESIGVSLGYSLIALALILVLGTPLAWWLARQSFRGKWALEAVILVALLTPPLAMGILLTTLFGPYGPVGSLVTHAGVELTNSAPAFVLAQFYGALPYYVVAARAAFENWSTLPVEMRAAYLDKVAAGIKARSEELA